MIEQQFIQFSDAIKATHDIALPIRDDGMNFFLQCNGVVVDIVNTNCDVIKANYPLTKTIKRINGVDYTHLQLSAPKDYIAPMEAFILRTSQLNKVGEYDPDYNVAPEDTYRNYKIFNNAMQAGTYRMQINSLTIKEYQNGAEYLSPIIYMFDIVAGNNTIYTSGNITGGVADDVDIEFTLSETTLVDVIITEMQPRQGWDTMSATGTITVSKYAYQYSNILRYVPNEDGYLSSLQYCCNEPEFGFPFFSIDKQKYSAKVSLPILLNAAQYTQTDKIYETRTGEQIVLYATIQKEYAGETDYIPEAWHEKIVTALSCDEVYINGERVTKSDSYEIDHDNYTFSDCGIRLTRATFKVKTNVVKRNSNC